VAVRSTDVAPLLTPQSQFSRAELRDGLSLGGSHVDPRLVVSHRGLTSGLQLRWRRAADFLVENVHHDVDVVAEDGVETHPERCLQLVVEL